MVIINGDYLHKVKQLGEESWWIIWIISDH